MNALLWEPAYWNWWALGLVLIIIDMLAPGTFILWIGFAALAVGLVVFLIPALGWQEQLLLFALLTLASIAIGWLYFKHRPLHSDAPLLNRRGQQYVGRLFTLETPIVNGQGKIRVDDTTWKIEGRDCPANVRVRVIGVDGVVLKVEVEGSLATQREE